MPTLWATFNFVIASSSSTTARWNISVFQDSTSSLKSFLLIPIIDRSLTEQSHFLISLLVTLFFLYKSLWSRLRFSISSNSQPAKSPTKLEDLTGWYQSSGLIFLPQYLYVYQHSPFDSFRIAAMALSCGLCWWYQQTANLRHLGLFLFMSNLPK